MTTLPNPNAMAIASLAASVLIFLLMALAVRYLGNFLLSTVSIMVLMFAGFGLSWLVWWLRL